MDTNIENYKIEIYFNDGFWNWEILMFSGYTRKWSCNSYDIAKDYSEASQAAYKYLMQILAHDKTTV